MKTFKKAVGLVVAVGLMASCSGGGASNDLLDALEKLDEAQETEFHLVEIDGEYAIDLPSHMVNYPGLNDDASLEYANAYAEKYIIVISESKQEFIDILGEVGDYDESIPVVEHLERVQSEVVPELGDVIYESKSEPKKINGMATRQLQVDVNVPGFEDPVSYWFAYMEGKDRLYTIWAWSFKSSKEDYEKEVKKMISSMKEL